MYAPMREEGRLAHGEDPRIPDEQDHTDDDDRVDGQDDAEACDEVGLRDDSGKRTTTAISASRGHRSLRKEWRSLPDDVMLVHLGSHVSVLPRRVPEDGSARRGGAARR